MAKTVELSSLRAPYALGRAAASLIAALALSAAAPTLAAETAAPAPAARASAPTLEALIPLAAQIGDNDKLEVYSEPAPAPNIAFTDADGQPVTLSEFRGRVVLVNFWATFCPPCIEEMPALDALQAELGGEAFEVVAINVDFVSAARAQAWLATNRIDDLTFYRDSTRQSALAFGAQGLPLTLLIDRSGAEVGRLLGAAAWDDAPALEAISLLIADPGQPAEESADAPS